MMHRLAAFALLAVTGFSVAGCASNSPPAPRFVDIRFTNEPPIPLQAAVVEVKDEYQPPFKPPNIEHTFPIPPARAATNWAQDRLKAADPSSRRRVRVTILDASVKEVDLSRTPGLRGAFTTDQAQRYDAVVALRVDLLNDRGFPERTASGRATRSRSVPENITPNDRDRVFYEMTEQLMQDLDQELERQIKSAFYPFVLS
jgi:hypothetical protein